MSEFVSDQVMDNIRQILRAQDPDGLTYFRISWLPLTEEDYAEVPWIERPFVKRLAGTQKHAEISWPEIIGPYGYGAWCGRWPKLPDNAGWLAQAKRFVDRYTKTPPIGARGAGIATHTFSTDRYVHKSFRCTFRDLLELWDVCRETHGTGFNTSGFYWSTIWPKQTTEDAFFCTEACHHVLKESGMLGKIVPLDADEADILTMNSGAVTPTILWDKLAHYGGDAANYIHCSNLDDNPNTTYDYVGDSASASDWI